jgi:hypothetical protein
MGNGSSEGAWVMDSWWRRAGGVVKECSVSVESLGVWARLALAARLSPRTPTRSPEPSLANWSSFIS